MQEGVGTWLLPEAHDACKHVHGIALEQARHVPLTKPESQWPPTAGHGAAFHARVLPVITWRHAPRSESRHTLLLLLQCMPSSRQTRAAMRCAAPRPFSIFCALLHIATPLLQGPRLVTSSQRAPPAQASSCMHACSPSQRQAAAGRGGGAGPANRARPGAPPPTEAEAERATLPGDGHASTAHHQQTPQRPRLAPG